MRALAFMMLVVAPAFAWLLHVVAPASRAANVTPAAAATVVTRDGTTTITLPDRPDHAVRFDHVPGGVVRWARLPSGALVAVADRKNDFDPSWAASLLAEGNGGTELADRVFHASRPLVTPDGNVVVERGRAGAVVPGRMRVDELTLDVVDGSGRARTIYAARGFEAHLVGIVGNEVVVYLIQPDVASLRAVDLASGAERVIAPSLAPFATDFAIVDGAIEFTTRDESHALVRQRIAP